MENDPVREYVVTATYANGSTAGTRVKAYDLADALAYVRNWCPDAKTFEALPAPLHAIARPVHASDVEGAIGANGHVTTRDKLTDAQLAATRAFANVDLHYEDSSTRGTDNQSRRVLRLIDEHASLTKERDALQSQLTQLGRELQATREREAALFAALEQERRASNTAATQPPMVGYMAKVDALCRAIDAFRPAMWPVDMMRVRNARADLLDDHTEANAHGGEKP